MNWYSFMIDDGPGKNKASAFGTLVDGFWLLSL